MHHHSMPIASIRPAVPKVLQSMLKCINKGWRVHSFQLFAKVCSFTKYISYKNMSRVANPSISY